MKAILKFNLDEEDSNDLYNFALCSKAPHMSVTIRDLDQWLRDEVKYQNLPPGYADAYDKVREKLRELLMDKDILTLVLES